MSKSQDLTGAEIVGFDGVTRDVLKLGTDLTVIFDHDKETKAIFTSANKDNIVYELVIDGNLELGLLSSDTISVYSPSNPDVSRSTLFIKFPDSPDKTQALKKKIVDFNTCKSKEILSQSEFEKRTESWSAVQYFQFYSYLSQQQNMMQDYIRTSTYQQAIASNATVDFRDKIVLDVGAGSGILSFFAAHCGAKRVYAVEASNMAKYCQKLVHANKLAGKIVVISGKIEEITLPEPVDVIISEPMGYMLYNERMLETYVHARKFLAKKYLQSTSNGKNPKAHGNKASLLPGLMFPTVANMYVVPFSDEALYAEQNNKANFWYQQCFHGMDLSTLRESAMAEYFNQPIVDTFDISICPALPIKHTVDFRTIDESEFNDIFIDLDFKINTCCTIHGLAFWFDVGFLGSKRDVWLSTSPTEPLTHWYQVRCMFPTPLFVQEDQQLQGSVRMRANSKQSYDVDIELVIPGTNSKISNTIDLKNPHFRYTGYPAAPPPGNHSKSPTDVYVSNMSQNAYDIAKNQLVYPSSTFVTEGAATSPNITESANPINISQNFWNSGNSMNPSLMKTLASQQVLRTSPQGIKDAYANSVCIKPTYDE